MPLSKMQITTNDMGIDPTAYNTFIKVGAFQRGGWPVC